MYIVAGKTLVAGASAIAVLGEFVSLDPSGQTVVIAGPSGKTTEPLSQFLGPSTTIATPTMGLGGIIQSLGGFAQESTTGTTDGETEASATPAVFFGGSTRLKSPRHTIMTGLLVGIEALYICII